jgi:hypothetical protein
MLEMGNVFLILHQNGHGNFRASINWKFMTVDVAGFQTGI